MFYAHRGDWSPWEYRNGLQFDNRVWFWKARACANGQSLILKETNWDSGFGILGMDVLILGLVWMCWKGLVRDHPRLVVCMEIPVRLVEGSSAMEARQRQKCLSSEIEIAIVGKSLLRLVVFGRGISQSGTDPESAFWTSNQTGVQGMMSELILGSFFWQCL